MSQYPRPPLAVSQLLRSLGQPAQKACNAGEHLLGPSRPAMQPKRYGAWFGGRGGCVRRCLRAAADGW